MSENLSNDKRAIELLEELVKWTKATSIPKVREILEELVRSPSERVLYKYSDGKTARKELSEISGIDEADISRDWKKWAIGGILEQVPSKGGSRGCSTFSLEDFGIDVPDLSKSKNNGTTDEQKTKKPANI